MSDMIVANTAHKLIKKTLEIVIKEGYETKVWGGTIPNQIGDKGAPCDFSREMIEHPPGLTLKLTNPLARWSDYSDHYVGITLTETEDSFQRYNPGNVIRYSKLYPHWQEDNGKFNYTYGERIAGYPYVNGDWNYLDQMSYTIARLKKHPSTRKACISTWYPPNDLTNDYVPCNMVFQLRVVDGKLDWITVIRSLDVLRGLTENIFMFTMWQEYASSQLGVPLGNYYTVALNPHVYKEQIDKGLHIQRVTEPYHPAHPCEAFRYPFPSKEFAYIDSLMFNHENYIEAHSHISSLPKFWKNWKLTLLVDWLRLEGHYELATDYASELTGVFKFPTYRRLIRKYPECFKNAKIPSIQKRVLDAELMDRRIKH